MEDNNCAFVFVDVAISRGGEDGQSQRLLIGPVLVLIARHLNLMASDYHSQSIVFEKFGGVVATVEVGAGPVLVAHPLLFILV